MAADAGKELVRRLLEEALVGARPEEADVLAGPAFVGHAPADRTFRGSDGLKAYAAMLRRGFPDLEATVEVVFGEGDTVVAEFTLRGTHRGWYRGVPPTKRPIELPGSAMAHVRDGAVDELWASRGSRTVTTAFSPRSSRSGRSGPTTASRSRRSWPRVTGSRCAPSSPPRTWATSEA